MATPITLHGPANTVVVGRNNGTHYHIPASGNVVVWDEKEANELRLSGLSNGPAPEKPADSGETSAETAPVVDPAALAAKLAAQTNS